MKLKPLLTCASKIQNVHFPCVLLLVATKINTLRTGSFKLFKRPFPGFLKILTLLNAQVNPICYLLALLAHHFLHASRIRVKSLTLRLLMSYVYIYIYMERLLLMFLDHTQRRSTFSRTPLDEWSARRRDLYLTTHDTHNRQISMPRWNSNPRSQQVSGRRPLTCWERNNLKKEMTK